MNIHQINNDYRAQFSPEALKKFDKLAQDLFDNGEYQGLEREGFHDEYEYEIQDAITEIRQELYNRKIQPNDKNIIKVLNEIRISFENI